MKQVKNCLYCGKEFEKPINETQKNWINRHKYCSRKCADNGRKGSSPWNKGIPITEEQKRKMSISLKGRKAWNKGIKITQTKGKGNGMWKGNKVGYFALHSWINREKGKAKRCEECGVTRKDKKIEWANIDHKYRRNIDDYKALCTKCHRAFDIKYNNWKG